MYQQNIQIESIKSSRQVTYILLSLSLPMILANMLETSYQLINMFWVGRLGTNAVAAISVNYPIVFLLVSLIDGLGVAASIIISKHIGSNNRTASNEVAAQTLLIALSISIVLACIGCAITPKLLQIMSVEPDIFSAAANYMRISFVGLLFLFSFIAFQSIMAGLGELKLPLYVVALSVVANAVLDPILIFGFGPIPPGGIEGSAWATLVSQAIAACIGLILLHCRYGIKFRISNLHLPTDAIKEIFFLGLPASVDRAMYSLGLAAMMMIVATFGTSATAAFGMGLRVFSFVLIPAFGISMATTIVTARSIGAKNYKLADTIAIQGGLLSFFVLTAVGVTIYIQAKAVASAFAPEDKALIEASATVIRYMAVSFAFYGIQMGLAGAFRGAGDTFFAMLMSILAIWVVQIPLAVILPRYTSLGSDGLWLTYPLASSFSATMAIARLKFGNWKKIDFGKIEKTGKAYGKPLTKETLQ